MTRDLAERLLDTIRGADAALHDIYLLTDEIEDVERRKKIRRVLGTAILDLYECVAQDIQAEFPDLRLDPEPPRKPVP